MSAVGSSYDTIALGNGAGDMVVVSDHENTGDENILVGSSYDTITLGNGAGDTVTADGGSYGTITLGNGAGDSVNAGSSSKTQSPSATAPVTRSP